MNLNSKIFIAGHRGLVGSAMVRKLKSEGFNNLVLRTRQEVDLCNQAQVNNFFSSEKIDYVVMVAARVGGILANQTYPAEFLYENVMMSSNVIHAAANYNVKKLLYLGSSCIYPKFAEQPIAEESLLTGPLEPTNEAYALAKIVGLKLCEKFYLQHKKSFISAMPTNLYGPGDNFHPTNSHVIPGMMRRFHEAKINNSKEVTLWGSGTALREFLHVDDLANALFKLLKQYNSSETINIGTGEDLSIKQLAESMKKITQYEGKIIWDTSKPDGTPRKILNVKKIHDLGWNHQINLETGLKQTYEWAINNNIF